MDRDSWFAPLSVDLVLKVLYVTFFHPFVTGVVVLCLRAEHMAWDAAPMRVAVAWALLVTGCWLLSAANDRLAFGRPRAVDLGDEVIVVTGGARGLGLLVAEVYGLRGASVAVLDVAPLENGPVPGVAYYRCDVGDPAQVAAAAAAVERDLGPPTVLVNNAAVVVGKRLLDLAPADIERSLRTNLLGPFFVLRLFLPALARSPRGATVVTVSSVLGELAAAQLADYAAAKAGLLALHRALTAELAVSHPAIRTVLVTLGQLSTPLFRGVRTPSPFLAPVVEPVDVAKELVAAIDGGRAAHLAMPFYVRWAAWYHVLPLSLQRLARWASGIDTAMATFVGRDGGSDEKRTEAL